MYDLPVILDEETPFSDDGSPFFEVNRFYRPFLRNMPTYHYHRMYELYYLVQGRMHYYVHGHTWLVQKGSLVMIDQGEIHRTTMADNKPVERILINFNISFIQSALAAETDAVLSFFEDHRKVMILSETDQGYVYGLLYRMLEEQKQKPRGYDAVLRTLLLELLLFLSRKTNELKSSESKKVDSSYKGSRLEEGVKTVPIHRKMTDVAHYMSEHYSKAITLQTVAALFSVTPCHLSRAFRNATSFSFMEYLTLMRLREARKLLRQDSLDIPTIALCVGYRNQAYFGRIFSRYMGISPRKYREQQAQKIKAQKEYKTKEQQAQKMLKKP